MSLTTGTSEWRDNPSFKRGALGGAQKKTPIDDAFPLKKATRLPRIILIKFCKTSSFFADAITFSTERSFFVASVHRARLPGEVTHL